MSVLGSARANPPAPPAPPPAPQGPVANQGVPLPLPQVDMMACREMQAWIAKLEGERRSLGRRNRYLAVVFAVAVLLLGTALISLHRATVGSYAVLDDVAIARHPASQGRLEFSFRVVSPGKVYYRRTSGRIQTDVIDYFYRTGPVERSWAWIYEPGKPIDVCLWSRRGLVRSSAWASFETSDRADIVVLIDTTGSMDPSIRQLQDKCAAFSQQLTKQSLAHRFALIGFGDAQEPAWLDRHDFTSDVGEFRRWVSQVQRFDGGDLPESALDALEEALKLPFDPQAIRRCYLVTDAEFHEPARSGATAAQIAARLQQQRVLLSVFSRPQAEQAYRKLLGGSGKFQEIENFGKVLSEGRILED